MEWLLANAAVLQLATSAITALVWIVYLQTFLGGYRRQQRSMILITSGAGRGMNSHCLVTNLGLEPISILSIRIDVRDGQSEASAVVPDRYELMIPEGNEDASATNQGPMSGGTMRDIGRFSTLLDRAATENADIASMDDILSVEITIVAANASSITGAVRRFERAAGNACFRAASVETRQLRSRGDRQKLHAVLEAA
ncbi:hypothetical protein [Falsirhodobacter xinxiangensis]|uniref:hypothetical protein n=1 Tax=Falsirhodobacter xinxiangensis TaxID=2530049 RepID=UPI0010AB1740|nr:hypothetical protein [Rhodobacter xinxiangensis]